MIKFKKARSPNETLNDLEAYISGVDSEAITFLVGEVKAWNEFSYAEIEELILAGRAQDLVDWRARYAEYVNAHLAPLWLAAVEFASRKATHGRITLDDSDIRVKEFLRTRAAKLIENLSNETRRAVASVILHGQSEMIPPKNIAKMIRPLIGLNTRQALANVNYREKIFRQLVDNGLSATAAAQRADKAAARYASKQHRFRAETIVHTELAFAYNRGAHEGIQAAHRAGLMNRCEMVWSTAGTNRVCSRCLELKDRVVGYSDESGVTLPPLHPRCRCVIIYREAGSLFRPTANRGAFAHLGIPMQLRAVKQICRKYGVDIAALRIKIQRNEELLKYLYAGSAAPQDVGRIDLFPNAFIDEEQLLRTVLHEGCHVKQFRKYGSACVQSRRFEMEKTAYRYEEFFLRIVRRRRHG